MWAVRSASPRPLVGKGSAEADELPARGRLATDLAALVEAGHIELVTGFANPHRRAGRRPGPAGRRSLHDQDPASAQDLVVEADR